MKRIVNTIVIIIFFIYITGAVIAGFAYALGNKASCIQNEGWIKGIIWCKDSPKSQFDMVRISLTTVVKGLIWPIDLISSYNEIKVLAQTILGYMYYTGTGVSQDYERAFAWSTKAAEQGYAAAQNNLGVMYYDGKGVTQNDKQAVSWFTKAAEQRYVEAQAHLGTMYYFGGNGVPKNYKQAYIWLSIAAANDAEYVEKRDIVASDLTPAILQDAQRDAEALNQKIERTKIRK